MSLYTDHAEAFSYSLVQRGLYPSLPAYLDAVHAEQVQLVGTLLDMADRLAGDPAAAREVLAAVEMHAALRDAIRVMGVVRFAEAGA